VGGLSQTRPGSVLLDELIDVLVAEAQECRRLLPLLEDQERALLGADASALAALLSRQEPGARRLVELERGRQELVRRLHGMLDLGDEPLTVSRLIALFPEPRQRLARLRAELRGVLGEIGRLTARNGFLVERSLGYLERLFNQLMSAAAQAAAPTYAATGRTGRPVPALSFLDRSA
jgi:hypothetical protein